MLTKTDNSHFSESLFYADTLPLPVQKCYNGNIAAACITHADSTYVFGYTYDAQNRLTESAQRRENQNKTSEWFNYDARGNITRLQRFNSERMIDDLELRYQPYGNQLLSIKDDGEDTDLYSTIEYHSAGLQVDTIMLYDANGNLISDADRGISRIKYNTLNLPDTIQFVNGNQIVNLYDAAGSKYKSIIYTNLASAANPCYDIAHYTSNTDSIEYKITEYNDNIETYYTSRDTTRRIFNATGYYADNTYYHYIKDHLGNNCAVVHSAADSVVQSTMYYASGVPMAESTGRDKQPYLYNGKEFVEAHGLNEYDSQARHYYATIMRTTTMDPMAEKYYHLSPYSWCGNNPIAFIDPDGKEKIVSLDPDEKRSESITKAAESYPENENVIHIWAHGGESKIQIYDKESKIKEDKIETEEIIDYLSQNSELWGKVENGEAMIIVLHSCETGKGDNSIAQQLSESDVLSNTIIVAPTENIAIGLDSKEIGPVKTKNEGGKTYTEKDAKGNIKYGEWRKYHKGKLIDSFTGKTKPIFKNPQKELDRYEKKVK